MPDFSYTARTKSGTVQTGTITAQSRQGAIDGLKQKELHPVIVKSNEKKGANKDLKLPGLGGVKPKDLVVFTRQFSTMISAGVPILRALTTLKEQTESPALKTALDQINNDVQGGTQLSDAIGKHPKIFSETYVNMVRAGEAGGILDTILNRLALQVEKDSAIKGKLKGAMIYPSVITIVAIGAVVFLMTGVIPKLTGILVESGVDLPLQTKIIMGISDFLTTKWPIIVGVLAIAIISFIRFVRTPGGKYKFHAFLLRLPIFGKIIMKVNVARFARTFSSLLGAGVSVLESLETTAGALTNVVIRQVLLDAVKEIKNGKPVSVALGESGRLPGIVIQMASVGEETGQMDVVLTKVAEFYEDEVDTVIASLSSIIEPILITTLGAVVGVIVASVLGPISSIQGSIN